MTAAATGRGGLAGSPPYFGLSVDYRKPAESPQPWPAFYDDMGDLAAKAEHLGLDYLWLPEHHFSPDGYAPSPNVVAAALTQRTSRIRIAHGIAVLPYYHPVRMAEDVALLDILSNGRFEPGLGIGWRAEEFAAFGIDVRQRGSRTDESLEIMTRLWAGERVTFHGKHFDLDDVLLMPPPVQQPGPRLWVGGDGPPGIRRAARFGAGLIRTKLSREAYDALVEEWEAAGRSVADVRVSTGLQWFMVSHDPKRTLADAGPGVLAWYQQYASWGSAQKPYASVDELVASGELAVVSPAEAVDRIGSFLAEVPTYVFNIKMRPPGLSYDATVEHLEIYATEVVPQLRAR